jgi:TrmH family RNA methyltransferase
VLTNTASDRVARVRRLARASARRQFGQLLVEGPQACREAALEGLVVDLYATADAAAHPEVAAAALDRGGYFHEASPEYVRAISPDSQGMAAVARDPWAGWGLAEALAAPHGPAADGQTTSGAAPAIPPGPAADGRAVALVAVFEQIQDPGNAGAAIRSADAAGADLVVFTDQSVDPAAPKVVRASAGSYFHLPVVRAGTAGQLIPALKAAGLRVLAADRGGSVPLSRAGLDQPTAWLFGNEARGLSAATLAASDLTVRIEIYGRAESLNLAMAATLCLYASAAARRAGRAS